ncbi:MAG: hypothetical protein ACFFAN_03390 [Promethearchaeota archaeon]
MTAQIPDEFIYNGDSFSLVGLKGKGLYTPEDFGIHPTFKTTACYRGYAMRYNFINEELILERMRVNTRNPPKINGIAPQTGEEIGTRLFDYCYSNLNLKTEFTGKVLLAKDFIQQMYVHMGFQRPISFKTVIEIEVENGDIKSIRDLSKKMEEYRNRDSSKDAKPSSFALKDVEKWIRKSFSLDY